MIKLIETSFELKISYVIKKQNKFNQNRTLVL